MARRRTFKDQMMQRAYDHYRHAEITDNRGSSDRAAYWNGRSSLGAQYPHLKPARNTIIYAIYVAGVDRQSEIDRG